MVFEIVILAVVVVAIVGVVKVVVVVETKAMVVVETQVVTIVAITSVQTSLKMDWSSSRKQWLLLLLRRLNLLARKTKRARALAMSPLLPILWNYNALYAKSSLVLLLQFLHNPTTLLLTLVQMHML